MTQKNPLLAHLNGETLAVSVQGGAWFEACLQSAALHPRAEEMFQRDEMSSSSEDEGFWPPADDWRASYRPYVVKGGVLHIPIMGVLLNRFSYQFGAWATGYTYIERAIRRGMADPEVTGIAFICDSPGGEVSGNFELVDKIYAYRGQKPMRAFASDRSYSAAYSLASAADKISMVRTGGVGSIGVVTLHLDFSEALNQQGIKATFIKAGARKTDGNHLEPLSRRAEARIQERIDSVMDIFVASVARNRGLEENAIRDMEADCFGAGEALANGLADKVEVYENALIAFTESCATGSGEDDMTTNPKAEQAITQEALNAAVTAARAEGVVEGKAEGARDGAAAERTRINAIVGHEAAVGKQDQALALALKSDMTVEAVAAVLPSLKADSAAVPEKTGEPKPAALAAVFDTAMGKDAPEVGADGGEKDNMSDDAKASASILGAYRGATGASKPAAKAA